MSLTWRRVVSARGLLLAAAGATVVITVLLTGLATYSRDAVVAGARTAIEGAPADERSILLRGPLGGADTFAERDAAVRDRVSGGLGGVDVQVSAMAAATGLELTGDLPEGIGGAATPAFASLVFLDGLADHADLVAGAWPDASGAASAPQAALGEPIARTLGVGVGDRIPVTSRLTGKPLEVTVVGVWRPKDPADVYWRLAPELTTGVAPRSSTYGPLVVARETLLRDFPSSASAAWLIQPEIANAGIARLTEVGAATAAELESLPTDVGIGDAGLAASRLPGLVDRLSRADLVGRSALVTPMLLTAVLGGYALLLVALLLSEYREGESALMRARGAARAQLAGMAVREAALVVLPAAIIAPALATEILRAAGGWGAPFDMRPRLDGITWGIAAAAALGCGLAMLVPSLRRGRTYVAEMANRSRPSRRTIAQRASLDIALVGLAVLAWFQLRQYAGPISRGGGGLGIDPLLAAAPTLGVLAGAALALRALPPLTRAAERFVDRRPWAAAMFGTWQAGRRPHAGPVLMIALAVGVSALAWCLAGSAERSLVDQANHQVGADLRAVETGLPPAGRTAQLAAVPGVTAVVPAVRETVGLGPDLSGPMVAVDASSAANVMLLRDDLADGGVNGVLGALSGAAVDPHYVDLVEQARLTGRVKVTAANGEAINASPFPVRTAAVFALPGGLYREVPLVTARGALPGGKADVVPFAVDLPADLGRPRLAGFRVTADVYADMPLRWELTDLAADARPLDRTTKWAVVDPDGTEIGGMGTGGLNADFQGEERFRGQVRPSITLTASPVPDPPVVPVVATPAALTALRLTTGAQTRMQLGRGEVAVKIVGTVDAVPGTDEAAALLVDLPSLSAVDFHAAGATRRANEHWIATGAGDEQAAATASAVGELAGLDVLDRREAAATAGKEAYGAGARLALFVAALGAALLAVVGLLVDVRATARRRVTELAVLNTLGAGPRLLAGSLVVEQLFLATIGVLVGLIVGIGVAATMAPLVILTPAAAPPIPSPALAIPWLPVVGTAVGLLILAPAISGMVATGMRQRLVAARLRMGADT